MLTVKDIVKQIGYGESTVQMWIHKGLLPAKCRKNKFYVKQETLDAFMASHKGTPRKPFLRTRSKDNYKQNRYEGVQYRDDTTIPEDKLPIKSYKTRKHKKDVIHLVPPASPLESTKAELQLDASKDNLINMFKSYLDSVYPTNIYTPKQFFKLKTALDILRGKDN